MKNIHEYAKFFEIRMLLTTVKNLTCPSITSETSVGFMLALAKHSLITTLPRSDAFKDDSAPQKDPVKLMTLS